MKKKLKSFGQEGIEKRKQKKWTFTEEAFSRISNIVSEKKRSKIGGN